MTSSDHRRPEPSSGGSTQSVEEQHQELDAFLQDYFELLDNIETQIEQFNEMLKTLFPNRRGRSLPTIKLVFKQCRRTRRHVWLSRQPGEDACHSWQPRHPCRQHGYHWSQIGLISAVKIGNWSPFSTPIEDRDEMWDPATSAQNQHQTLPCSCEHLCRRGIWQRQAGMDKSGLARLKDNPQLCQCPGGFHLQNSLQGTLIRTHFLTCHMLLKKKDDSRFLLTQRASDMRFARLSDPWSILQVNPWGSAFHQYQPVNQQVNLGLNWSSLKRTTSLLSTIFTSTQLQQHHQWTIQWTLLQRLPQELQSVLLWSLQLLWKCNVRNLSWTAKVQLGDDFGMPLRLSLQNLNQILSLFRKPLLAQRNPQSPSQRLRRPLRVQRLYRSNLRRHHTRLHLENKSKKFSQMFSHIGQKLS